MEIDERVQNLEEEVRDLEKLRKRFVCERMPSYRIILFRDMSDPRTLGYKIVSWHWDFGDGETSKEQNPVHLYNEAGVCEITLTVKNECGAENYSKGYMHFG